MPKKKSQPYSITYNAGYYYFVTKNNLVYSCAFHNLTPHLPPILGIYDIEISDFDFFPAGKSQGDDPRVPNTVAEVLKGYFQNERRVVIYLCDATDGRSRERQALFTRWHRKNISEIDHQPIAIFADEFAVYGGILTRRDFPYPQVLQDELIAKAGELIMEKFGR